MKIGSLAVKAILSALLLVLPVAAFAQLPPASGVIPPEFKLVGERTLGATMFIEAKKPNQNFPKPHMDQGIKLEISWSQNPMASQILNMLAQQPEDPAAQDPGSVTRTEPCGKQRYRDGILTCRKIITPWVGGGSGPDLVTYRIGWAGKSPTGLLGISINNLCGSKEAGVAWIDSIIPKITKSK